MPPNKELRRSVAGRKIGVQFAWISGGRIIAALLQALLFLLLARQIEPSDFGLFAAVYGSIVVGQALLDFGLSTLVIKERASDPRNTIVTAATRIIDLTSFILLFSATTALLLLGVFKNPIYLELVPLALWAAAEKNVEGWLGVRLADGDAHINSWTLILRRVGAFSLFLILPLFGTTPLLSFAISTSLTSLMSALLIRRITKPLLPLESQNIPFRQTLQESWHYWINSLGTQLRNLDTLVVSLFAGPVYAGFYGAASRVTGPLRILSTSLAAVILPAASSKENGALRNLLKPSLMLMSTIVLIYTLLIFSLPVLVPNFLGEEYIGAIIPMQIVIAGLVFAAMASLLNSILQGLGMQKSVGRVSMTTSILCLAIVAVLSHSHQAIGASLGLASTFLLQLILLSSVLYSWSRKNPMTKPS